MTNSAPTTRMRLLQAAGPAALAGLIAVATIVVLRAPLGTRLLAELVIDASPAILGPDLFNRTLERFGPLAKPLIFTSVTLAEAALYTLLGSASAVLLPTWPPVRRIVLAAAVGALVLFAITTLIVVTTYAAIGSASDWVRYALSLIIGSSVFGATVGIFSDKPGSEAAETSSSRRYFLRILVGANVALLAATVVGKTVWHVSSAVRLRRPYGPTPEVTANADFYIVSKNLIDPVVDGSTWRLRVGGRVTKMLDLGAADIGTFTPVEEYATMQCISNPVGGELMGNALWTGFRLSEVIDRAQVLPSARYVVFRCADDYTESMPIEFARMPAVLLVHRMNGEPLPSKHGFPLRLLAPGKYGLKHPKWITEIALMDEETFGYWQQRYWTQEGRMNTSSRIDVPADDEVVTDAVFRIHGVAFSGDRGIRSIEVTTDNGGSWHEATMKPPLSPYTWVLWYYDWTTPGSGKAEIFARATDGTGEVQTAKPAPPHPSGATGYPHVTVKVTPPA